MENLPDFLKRPASEQGAIEDENKMPSQGQGPLPASQTEQPHEQAQAHPQQKPQRAQQPVQHPAKQSVAPAHSTGNAHAAAGGESVRATHTGSAPHKTGDAATRASAKRKGPHGAAHIANGAKHAGAAAPAPADTTAPNGEQAAARKRVPYIPALDGLRTLAVVAVVLYHLNLPWIQGGLLGVTVFFVLSGYLITRLLLAEFDGTKRIDLKRFWIRRVRRLVPAIVTVVVVTIVLCTFFNHVMLTKMRPDIVPSLLFFNNWWQILQNVSYFDALGDPSPLTHFWSLAIEEQFYLLWPPILLCVLKLGGKRTYIRRGVLVAALVSAVAMMALYTPGVDPSRIYYGTDTRVFSLLLGAWLAFIPQDFMTSTALGQLVRDILGIRSKKASETGPVRIGGAAISTLSDSKLGEAGKRARRAGSRMSRGVLSVMTPMDILGGVGLIGLLALMVFTNGYTAFQYRGGTLLCSIFTMMLIAACVQNDSLLARAFSAKPLVWIGVRSYGIYLWHYPLLLLMNPVGDITAKPWWVYVLQVAIVVLAAELSYRFIETPFRHGLIGKTIDQLRRNQTTPQAIIRRHIIPVICGGAVLAVALGGLIFVPETSALSNEGAKLLEDGADSTPMGSTPADEVDTSDVNSDGIPDGAYDVVMVGDSVSVRIVPVFQEVFPHGYIDAKKNRQFSAGIDIMRNLVGQNLAGRTVVIALGTNGAMTDEQIDTLMGIVGENRTVAFVTTRSPQPWVGATNDTLKRAAERYDNVRIIDWYAYSEGRNDLFDGDGTHLSSQGAQEYVELIRSSIADIIPYHLEDAARQDEVATNLSHAFDGAATSLSQSIASAMPREVGNGE